MKEPMKIMSDNDFRAELRKQFPTPGENPIEAEERIWRLMVKFGKNKKARAFAEVTEMADVEDMTVDGLRGWAALRAAGLAQEKETPITGSNSPHN